MNRQDAKAPREEAGEELDALAHQVVDAAFRVHSQLGPGLLESVYEIYLVHELSKRGLAVERQVALPVIDDGFQIDAGFRIDLVIAGELIVELKAVESLLPIHKAQVLTYLKLSRRRLGLLINFNVPLIKDGIRRIISSAPPHLAPWRLGGSIE